MEVYRYSQLIAGWERHVRVAGMAVDQRRRKNGRGVAQSEVHDRVKCSSVDFLRYRSLPQTSFWTSWGGTSNPTTVVQREERKCSSEAAAQPSLLHHRYCTQVRVCVVLIRCCLTG